MNISVRTGLEIAAVVLLLFSALLDPLVTFALAAVLIAALLGSEFMRRGRASWTCQRAGSSIQYAP